MVFQFTTADMLALVASVCGWFLTALLVTSGKSRIGWLAGFTGLFAAAMLMTVVKSQVHNPLFLNIINWFSFLNFAAGPCLFLYTQFAVGKDARANRLHFVPALVVAVFTPFFPASSLDLLYYALVVQVVTYLTMILWVLRGRRRSLEQQYSNLSGVDLGWLQTLSWWLLALMVADVALFPLLTAFGANAVQVQTVFNFCGTVYIIWLSKSALGQLLPPPQETGRAAYEKSGLDEGSMAALAQELVEAVDARKLYLNPTLTLRELAKEVGMTPHTVSEVLNRSVGQSFYEFINRRRVDEARSLLVRTGDTVLDIAFAAGFNNKVSFNKAFKEYEGVTPSMFRKQRRN